MIDLRSEDVDSRKVREASEAIISLLQEILPGDLDAHMLILIGTLIAGQMTGRGVSSAVATDIAVQAAQGWLTHYGAAADVAMLELMHE